MELETYKQAKHLRELIDKIDNDKRAIEKMRKREGDEEFNALRLMAFDYVSATLERKEKDFKNL